MLCTASMSWTGLLSGSSPSLTRRLSADISNIRFSSSWLVHLFVSKRSGTFTKRFIFDRDVIAAAKELVILSVEVMACSLSYPFIHGKARESRRVSACSGVLWCPAQTSLDTSGPLRLHWIPGYHL